MPGYFINGRIVFFSHIPKCGGTSVERGLAQLGPEFLNDRVYLREDIHPTICSAQHFHAALIDRVMDPSLFSYRFAVVRDPLVRLKSEFRHRRDMSALSRKRSLAGAPRQEPDTFDAWVAYAFAAYKKHRYLFDNHIRPQSAFTTPDTEVFRLEDGLDPVFERISEVCGVSISAPSEKHQMSRRRELAVSEDTLSRVAEFYADDYAQFSYALP